MNELQTFNNEQFGQVRMAMFDGEPFFMLADVCRVLEIVNPTRAKERLNVNGLHTMKVIDSMNREQQATFINESNLYKLVFTSRKKEAETFADWVTGEVLPSIRKTGNYSVAPEPTEYEKQNTEISLLNAKARVAELWMRLGDRTSIPEYRQITDSYASLVLAGKPVLPLPEVNQKTYSATEIADMLGVTPQKIGRLSNANNLKTKEYGKWFYDKSQHSTKEVETFRYFDSAIPVFKELLA